MQPALSALMMLNGSRVRETATAIEDVTGVWIDRKTMEEAMASDEPTLLGFAAQKIIEALPKPEIKFNPLPCWDRKTFPFDVEPPDELEQIGTFIIVDVAKRTVDVANKAIPNKEPCAESFKGFEFMFQINPRNSSEQIEAIILDNMAT